mgnify:CR=1 FL=1
MRRPLYQGNGADAAMGGEIVRWSASPESATGRRGAWPTLAQRGWSVPKGAHEPKAQGLRKVKRQVPLAMAYSPTPSPGKYHRRWWA